MDSFLKTEKISGKSSELKSRKNKLQVSTLEDNQRIYDICSGQYSTEKITISIYFYKLSLETNE